MQDSLFYPIVDVLLLIYAVYSWYWQAKVNLRAKFRISLVIWTLLIIGGFFYSGYLNLQMPAINFFLALLLLTSLIDGSTGLAQKRAVVSGFFKRTIDYSKIKRVLLIDYSGDQRDRVICILGTSDNRQYYLQFATNLRTVIQALEEHLGRDVKFEIGK